LYNAISLSGLTKLCEKITHNKLKVKKVKRTSGYDVPYFVTSITKVKSIYKWVPTKNISDIVYDIFCWQKNNLNKLKSFF
jgi:CDP-paratose 2-epimerase